MKCLVIADHGLFEFPLLSQGIAKIGIRVAVSGLETEDLAIGRLCVLYLSQCFQGSAQVNSRFSIVRLEMECLIIAGDCILELALTPEGVGKLEMNLAIIRLE